MRRAVGWRRIGCGIVVIISWRSGMGLDVIASEGLNENETSRRGLSVAGG